MFRQDQEIFRVEFEAIWIKIDDLVGAIEELNENWRNLSFVAGIAARGVSLASSFAMSASSMERMAKGHEILFHQCREPFSCSIVRIQKELCEYGDLAGSIPSMATMQQDGQSMNMDPKRRFP